MSSQVEIPNFKLAKVGQKKERKGGGIPWLFGGKGAGGALVSGAGSGVVTTAAKVLLAVLIASMGGGAYMVGKSLAPQNVAKKPKAFAGVKEKEAKYAAADLAKVKKTEAAPSGLALVSGSLDGKTPEQRAAEAAAAEAAAKAQAEADAKAAAEAAAKEQPTAAGVPAGMDPAALAAAAAGGADKDKDKKEGPFGSRFGKMASALGAGGSSALAGGAGLSGGVGRSFDGGRLGSNLGIARSFSGGPRVGRTSAGSARASGFGGRGLAARQLAAANQLSNQARRGADETRASNASAAFDNNPGGNAVTGGGAGSGSNPANSVLSDPPSNPGGGGSSGPTEGSESGFDECTGGQINSSEGGCIDPPKPKGTDATPWKMMIQLAKILAIIGTICLLIAAAIALIAGKADFTGIAFTIAQILGGIAAFCGIIVTFLGIMIAAMGQSWQGILITVGGLGLSIGGAIVALSPESGEKSLAQANYMQAVWTSLIGAALGGGGAIAANNTDPSGFD